MTPDEIRACITYANGIDPRIQMTAPNAQLWGRALGEKQAVEVTAAIQVYYERPWTSSFGKRPAVEVADIKRIIYDEKNRQIAVQSALEAGPVAREMTHEQLRRGVKERFPEEYALGVRQGNADRAYATMLREGATRQEAAHGRDLILKGMAS